MQESKYTWSIVNFFRKLFGFKKKVISYPKTSFDLGRIKATYYFEDGEIDTKEYVGRSDQESLSWSCLFEKYTLIYFSSASDQFKKDREKLFLDYENNRLYPKNRLLKIDYETSENWVEFDDLNKPIISYEDY